MNNKVTLCENALDSSTWTTHENVGDVRDFLVSHFGIWPDTAHIYLDHVANNADITPHDEAGIERLGKVNGHFFVVVYPQGVELILLIVALVVAAVAISLVFLFRPSLKKNQNESSANNQLADRENQARPEERIPDIYGQLWATFDLLAVPYRTFESNVEFEHCFMCVGRGEYAMLASDIRDDITPSNQEAGNTVQVYGPGKNPNLSSTPDIQIGAVITERVVNLQVFGSVNGQILRAPNLGTVLGNNNIRFKSPNLIETNDPNVDFTKNFSLGDLITVGGLNANDALAVDSGGVQPSVDLSVQASITGINATQISLNNPAASNANWSALAAFAGGVSTYRSIDLVANGTFTVPQLTATIGGFTILNPSMTEIWCNFVANQGMYVLDSKGRQYAWGANVRVFVQQCDSFGTPFGQVMSYVIAISGNATDRLPKGSTLKIPIIHQSAAFGGVIIYAKRTTNTAIAQGNTVVDEVQWRDCYVVSDPGNIDFGNITTVQTKTEATLSATSVKSRKMNALVTRKLPQWTGSGTTFSAPTATKNAADILCAMALDPFIGDRTVSELDLVNLYQVAGPGGDIETYFANSQMTEFCYTFDDSKVSFEESVSDLAQAIFCVAYRRGNLLELSFERPTVNSVLLFNHRNKVPRSETRTVTFGTVDDNDGITLDYIEPNAPNYPNLDTTVKLYFPQDQSAKNPKKLTAIGVRNSNQAMALGWRLYNKLIYQNIVVEFDSTEEAALLVIQDRISVADNTRADVQDGDVLDQTALLLTLSQDVVYDGVSTYSIFLQNPDGTVENIGITPGPQANQVLLAAPPTLPCVIDPDMYARTTYMIVSSAPTQATAFLLTEKTPKDGKLYSVKAVNYAPEYYVNDIPTPPVPGVTPFSLFMPTTRGQNLYFASPNPTWGTLDAAASSGVFTEWFSAALAGFKGYLYWDYSPPSFYGAPGSDDPTYPSRTLMTGVYAVIAAFQNMQWFCHVGVSVDGGATWPADITNSIDNVNQQYAVDITALLIAQYGSLALADFSQVAIRMFVTSSINAQWPKPGLVLTATAVGLIFLFNGATIGSAGNIATGGGFPGGTPGPGGFILNPPNPLYQIDPTTIGMVACTCQYVNGPQVQFGARTWPIADPGSTPVAYYVGINDPGEVGDSLGTQPDLIGTSAAAVNGGTPGWVAPIGPIMAIHGSSGPGSGNSGGGGGTPGTPGTGGADAGFTYRFSITQALHGDFVFAHGLGIVPIEVRIGNTSDGSIRFQAAPSPPWDITNVYLNASDDNLTCFLEIDV